MSRCDLCGKPVTEPNQRFCCEAHAEEHFRRANVEFEEKTFWADETEYE